MTSHINFKYVAGQGETALRKKGEYQHSDPPRLRLPRSGEFMGSLESQRIDSLLREVQCLVRRWGGSEGWGALGRAILRLPLRDSRPS